MSLLFHISILIVLLTVFYVLGFIFKYDYDSQGKIIKEDYQADPYAPIILTVITFILFEILFWVSTLTTEAILYLIQLIK